MNRDNAPLVRSSSGMVHAVKQGETTYCGRSCKGWFRGWMFTSVEASSLCEKCQNGGGLYVTEPDTKTVCVECGETVSHHQWQQHKHYNPGSDDA